MNNNTLCTSDIIAQIADENPSLTKKAVKGIVDQVFGKISNVMMDGGAVTIGGFGRFHTKTAAERTFTPPNSLEPRVVEERQLPKVTFSKTLVSAIKN